ncbi:uncharacterized protein CIMG_12891 [Coccidioides immitis RS]|uniref:Uncharacterized protein n=1 Tax=Coccidioides immitis (strain RS) TaxID=246410 RepID=A0A0D8JVN7_COCIM|nr:uncharacterized protein CIMG_12891 [Coccidioides immitis RS]KJF60343.1 hypothetical protein CIMG_12891 [Coccidioides immitis RS]
MAFGRTAPQRENHTKSSAHHVSQGTKPLASYALLTFVTRPWNRQANWINATRTDNDRNNLLLANHPATGCPFEARAELVSQSLVAANGFYEADTALVLSLTVLRIVKFLPHMKGTGHRLFGHKWHSSGLSPLKARKGCPRPAQGLGLDEVQNSQPNSGWARCRSWHGISTALGLVGFRIRGQRMQASAEPAELPDPA